MKKLIPALCMLLIAAALLGTSTYAWFSMNNTVTATGMQVKAKSDTKFLQIKLSTASWNDTDSFIEADVEMTAGKELFPVHPYKSLSDDRKTPVDFDGSTPVWVTAYSTSISDADAGVGDTNLYTVLDASTVEASYALKKSFTVRLKPGTGVDSASADLKVTGVTFAAVDQSPDNVTDGLSPALRALFVCGENRFVWKNGAFVEGTANSVLTNTVTTADDATQIDVYIYFDGEDDYCTTNNALTPDDYTMEFTLTLG